MLKIVGYAHSQGSFVPKDGKFMGQEVAYDNIKLFYLTDTVKDVKGFSVGEVKIPFDTFEALTGVKVTEINKLLERQVDFVYQLNGKYPQLTAVRVVA